MKLAIDTDAIWHRIRRAFWRWTTKGYGPGFTVPGRCADCGIPLSYYECTYYGKSCERCEGIAFHAQQAAEAPICADTGVRKWPGDCWNVRCQLGKTCCLAPGVRVDEQVPDTCYAALKGEGKCAHFCGASLCNAGVGAVDLPEPDCWAILTPNGSRLVPPAEAKGRKDAYRLFSEEQVRELLRPRGVGGIHGGQKP